MGDSGAQVLGFALASLGLASSWTVAGSTVATLLLPVLVLAVPILDTTLVTVVRLLEGRPVTRGGRDHTSHRLVYQGLSDKRAVVLLGVVSAALGLTSLGYKVLDDTRITLAGVLITFAFLLQFGSYLADVNRAPVESDATSFLRSLFVHRRRLVEVVVDFALIAASFTVAVHHPRSRGRARSGTATSTTSRCRRSSSRATSFFVAFGLYRGVWRYAGARDAASIFAAVVLSEVRRVRLPRGDRRLARVPARRLRDRRSLCALLIGASRFWERAVAHALGSLVGRGTQTPHADRRRRQERAEPAARAARDAGRPRRRLRRRRPRASAAAASRACPSSRASTTSAGRSAASRPTPCSSRSPKRSASGSTPSSRRAGAPTSSAGSCAGTSTSIRAPSSEPPPSERGRNPRRADEARPRLTRRGPAARSRPAREHLPLALDRLLRRGVEAHDAVALHGRARDDADLACDRRHRPRGAARRAVQVPARSTRT